MQRRTSEGRLSPICKATTARGFLCGNALPCPYHGGPPAAVATVEAAPDTRAALHNAASAVLAAARAAHDAATVQALRTREALDAAQAAYEAIGEAIEAGKVAP